MPKQRKRRVVGGNQPVRPSLPNAVPSSYTVLRYRLQATKTEGVAANSDSQDCPSDSSPNRSRVRSDWRFVDMGQRSGTLAATLPPNTVLQLVTGDGNYVGLYDLRESTITNF